MERLIKSRYSAHDPKKYAFNTVGESKTQSQFAAECDINNILARYQKHGTLTHINKASANYGDFTSVDDYQTSMNKIIEAEKTFNSLPSSIRKRFGNDPAQLIGFVTDDKNREEAIKLGLINIPIPTPSFSEQMQDALEKHDEKRKKAETLSK